MMTQFGIGRNIICCFGVYLGLSTNVFCQDRQHRLSIQPSVGVLFSSLRDAKSPFGDNASSFESSTVSSETYGARIAYRLSKRFSLVSGYDFVSMKSNSVYTGFLDFLLASNFDAYTRAEIDLTNSYHQIPIQVRIQMERNRLSFFLDAGLYGAILKSEYLTRNIKTFLADGTLAFEGMTIKRDHGRTNEKDWGVALGGGISYQLTERLSILFNPRVSWSLEKMDGVYTNDSVIYPRTVGFFRVVNDYFSLNSNAKYFTISLNGGISYKLL